MHFHYDKKEDALYIRFDKTEYHESREVQDGIILDYAQNGQLIGIELLDASQKLSSSFQAQLNQKTLPATIQAVGA